MMKKEGMMNCKPVSTPMTILEKLSAHVGVTLEPQGATKYWSIVVAMQYMALTRPDLLFPVNKVCQFLHRPTIVHWISIKRILRYLQFTLKVGFRIDKSFYSC
jgi:hypothetical protein